MLHSLSAQVSYFSDLIQRNPDWIFAGIYTDEVTGTTKERKDFQRLLADCRNGQIDMIIVKSLSRFARNTVTLLETVRGLKVLDVDVFFRRTEHTLHERGWRADAFHPRFFCAGREPQRFGKLQVAHPQRLLKGQTQLLSHLRLQNEKWKAGNCPGGSGGYPDDLPRLSGRHGL